MQLGAWALIQKSPSLLAILPLILFIVLNFIKDVHPMMPVLISVIVGFVLTGNGPVAFGQQLAASLGSPMGIMGFLGCVATGLGLVLEQTGISRTTCMAIVRFARVHSIRGVFVVIIVCEFVLTFFMGSMASAAAIMMPILIPLMSAYGITPAAAAVAALLSGFGGLVSAPFFASTAYLLELTGLSYGEYFTSSAMFISLAFVVCSYFCARFIQRFTADGAEQYETDVELKERRVEKREAFNAIVFYVSFLLWIVYSIVTKRGTTFILFAIPFQTALAAILGRMKFSAAVETFGTGCKKLLIMWFVLLLYQMLVNVIDAGGGFEALGNMIVSLVGQNVSKPILIILATFVGAFGISGATQAQMMIIHELFGPMITATGISMECWSIALLGGSYLTQICYPNMGIIAPMSICGTNKIKEVMIGMWITTGVVLLLITVYAFIMPAIIG